MIFKPIRSSKSLGVNFIANGINDNLRWLWRRQRPFPSGEYPDLQRLPDNRFDELSLASPRNGVSSLILLSDIFSSVVEFIVRSLDETDNVSFVCPASNETVVSSTVEFETYVEFSEAESEISVSPSVVPDEICRVGSVVGLLIGFIVKSA